MSGKYSATSSSPRQIFTVTLAELACRRHLEVLPQMVNDALKEARIDIKDVNLIAVTAGPGLVGALLVGLSYAKSLAYTLKIPLTAVNHIAAHLQANFIESPAIQMPCIGLVVSGGHTSLVEMTAIDNYKILGQTLDDAAGEAFDKVAKLLKLDYPGGPVIDRLAKEGNPRAIPFPRAMQKKSNYDFSFSGLKTAVVYYVKGYPQYRDLPAKDTSISIADLAASFQEAVVDQLLKKAISALEDRGETNLILGGGVSRNSRLRSKFKEEFAKRNWRLYLPSTILCTDNAAMIAAFGYHRWHHKGADSLDIDANPQLSWNY